VSHNRQTTRCHIIAKLQGVTQPPNYKLSHSRKT